jgi:DNA-binding phage protein
VTGDHLAAMKEMRAAGKKIAQISRIVGLDRPTIYRVLAGTEQQPPEVWPHGQ